MRLLYIISHRADEEVRRAQNLRAEHLVLREVLDQPLLHREDFLLIVGRQT